MKRAVVGLAALAALSCAGEAEVRPQWLVTLRTDAPLPTVADRVLVEVTDERGALACSACRRTFDAAKDAWPLSFGVEATSRPLVVRARLFDARFADGGGEPLGDASIDVRERLPTTPGPVTATLAMRCFGARSTADSACDPRSGAVAPLATMTEGSGDTSVVPGSFDGARVPPCDPAAARAHEVCVDGGLAFFRGAPATATATERGIAQLVRVSSFYLDRTELTVGRYRALLADGKVRDEPTRRTDDRSEQSLCTFLGRDSEANDAMPLNCVSFELAAAACAADGARLPSEAEMAYASTNGGAGTAYPWGDGGDPCARAIVARGNQPFELDVGAGFPPSDCRFGPPLRPYGPSAVTSDDAVLDATSIGIYGLAGNLAEMVRDDYAPLESVCWRKIPLLVDPVCVTAEPRRHVVRGGAWSFPVFAASSGFRSAVADPRPATFVGFRCARDVSR